MRLVEETEAQNSKVTQLVRDGPCFNQVSLNPKPRGVQQERPNKVEVEGMQSFSNFLPFTWVNFPPSKEDSSNVLVLIFVLIFLSPPVFHVYILATCKIL